MLMIEVFKTNVENKRQAGRLLAALNPHFPSAEINFDLDDCDSILRVNDDKVCLLTIIKILTDQGFECEVLE
jgi:hypothetical protein